MRQGGTQLRCIMPCCVSRFRDPRKIESTRRKPRDRAYSVLKKKKIAKCMSDALGFPNVEGELGDSPGSRGGALCWFFVRRFRVPRMLRCSAAQATRARRSRRFARPDAREHGARRLLATAARRIARQTRGKARGNRSETHCNALRQCE